LSAHPGKQPFTCRERCGACCIAPSISSAIPGMPAGKPAGVRCVQLDEAERCRIFGHPQRPAVCASLRPSPEMCGDTREQALRWLGHLERSTAG
jgi:Fe-S-cluster containining protein